MRLVLLGTDPELSPLLAWIARHPEHELVAIAGVPGAALAALQKLFPTAALLESWEQLLEPAATGGAWDALLLGRSLRPDDQERALRRLARQGHPVITAHPALESLLAAYELEMFQRERQAYLAPWLPLRNHPLVATFAAWIKDEHLSPLGKIDRLVISRAETDRSRSAVLGDVARDLDLIRAFAGEVNGVLAVGNGIATTEQSERSYAALGLQISLESSLLVRWGIEPADGSDRAELQLHGSEGRVHWLLPTLGDPGLCHLHSGGKETTVSHDEWSYAAAAETFLAQALAREPLQPSWNDAARSIELTDAVERSLKRGRKIEVRIEEADDLGNFKGIMASVGCGILMFGLFLMGLCILSAVIFRAAGWEQGANVLNKAWPWVLLLMSAAYLGLQLFIKLTVKPNRRSGPKPRNESTS
jgi:predicted dehydrogenase